MTRHFNPKNRPTRPPPREVLELVAACRALYDAIDRLDATAAAVVELSRNDLRALNLLERGPVKARSLGASLGLTSGAVTALVDRLEARGLVTREADPEDRRGTLVAPTASMFSALGPLYRGVATRVAALAEAYGPRRATQAATIVRDIAGAYGEAATAARTPSSTT